MLFLLDIDILLLYGKLFAKKTEPRPCQINFFFRERTISNFKFYLPYLFTGFLSLTVNIGIYKSTIKPGYDAPNATEFDDDFDLFFRDDDGRAPKYIASHLVSRNACFWDLNTQKNKSSLNF